MIQPHEPIPLCRDILLALADEVEEAASGDVGQLVEVAQDIRYWANATRRRAPLRPKADPSGVPVTPELAEEIRAYAAQHPTLTQHEIAAHFGVNQGRVSAALAGEL